MTTWYTLNITGSTNDQSILQQIDQLSLIRGSGSPTGVVAAANSGVWYYDYTNKLPYLCTQTDGTIGGSVWAPQNFIIGAATHSSAGIVELATNAIVQAQSDDTMAITSVGAASTYAQKGINADISELTALATPLTQGQGGTGATSLAVALLNALPSLASYNNLSSNSAGTALVWTPPGTSIVALPTVTSTTLLTGSCNICQVDSITLNLPASPSIGAIVWFALANVNNILLTTTDGSLIMANNPPMTLNIPNYAFAVRYTGNTNGWWIVT